MCVFIYLVYIWLQNGYIVITCENSKFQIKLIISKSTGRCGNVIPAPGFKSWNSGLHSRLQKNRGYISLNNRVRF